MFDSEKKLPFTVLGHVYYEKWAKMSIPELKKEMELVESRIAACPDRKIMAQLTEIRTMLESYTKTRSKTKE